MPEQVRIAPSILAADPLRLLEGAEAAVKAGADEIHVDIMDGHFVPNMSFSPSVVRALRRAFPEAWLDVHLMMDQPERWIEEFTKAGASGLTVHAEAVPSPEILARIRDLGAAPGISLKPATPAEALRDFLPLSERVLIMTVEPGFGGQKLMDHCAEKAAQLRAMGYLGHISCDGGVTLENMAGLAALGVDTLVMGTTFFHAADPSAVVRAVHAL